jgi:hypothetical protein
VQGKINIQRDPWHTVIGEYSKLKEEWPGCCGDENAELLGDWIPWIRKDEDGDPPTMLALESLA